MTYPILQAIKVHICTNNTEGCIPLALGGDHTMTYPILQECGLPLKLRVYILSVLLVHTCTLIAWSIG
jgi:arginase family enzyme